MIIIYYKMHSTLSNSNIFKIPAFVASVKNSFISDRAQHECFARWLQLLKPFSNAPAKSINTLSIITCSRQNGRREQAVEEFAHFGINFIPDCSCCFYFTMDNNQWCKSTTY
jgi:hypothetical protein